GRGRGNDRGPGGAPIPRPVGRSTDRVAARPAGFPYQGRPEGLYDGGSTRPGIAPGPIMSTSEQPTEAVTAGATPEEASPEPPGRPPPGPPERIGRYRIVRALGEGAFGRVYLAHDDDLHRPVAIKVARPERAARGRDVDVHLEEGRNLARLDHPHIVP